MGHGEKAQTGTINCCLAKCGHRGTGVHVFDGQRRPNATRTISDIGEGSVENASGSAPKGGDEFKCSADERNLQIKIGGQ